MKKHAVQGIGQRPDLTPSSAVPSEALSVDGNLSMIYLRMLLRESNRIKRRADKQSITDVPSVRENSSLKACRLTMPYQSEPSSHGINSLSDYFANLPISKPSAKKIIKKKQNKKGKKLESKSNH